MDVHDSDRYVGAFDDDHHRLRRVHDERARLDEYRRREGRYL